MNKARQAIACGLLVGAAACRQAPPAVPPLRAQLSGTLTIVGLTAAVRVVRDRWGVPHIFAESRDDAFVAQGFVQAEDRLFQMEVWRRTAEGRLAEVLGANFIERDAMTRRLQYRGDREAEWASYPAGTREVAEAFVRGVNAWVALVREQRPALFIAVDWPVVFWTAEDLLTRTDSYDRQGTLDTAMHEPWPAVVMESLQRAVAPAFFSGLARATALRRNPQSSAPTARQGIDDPPTYPVPSPRYLVHLHTPQWNAIGAAVPWRPGIVVGHDGTAIWDRFDPRYRAIVRTEPIDATVVRVVSERIRVKGRNQPFTDETRHTVHGVVIATDRLANRQFTLQWEGHRTGTAPAFSSERGEQRRSDVNATSVALFVHPLAIVPAISRTLNAGPFERIGGNAPVFELVADSKIWDASRAMNAPGQSEDPESPHYADLAALWAAGNTLTLSFTEAAVSANAETTLTLVPAARR